jgi:hypothetical protein
MKALSQGMMGLLLYPCPQARRRWYGRRAFSCEDLPAALRKGLLNRFGCPQQGWRNGASPNGAVVDARAQHTSPAEPAKGGLTNSQDLYGFLRGGGKSHWGGLSNVGTGSVGRWSFPVFWIVRISP